MARRPKTSPLEDIVSLVALLPWWACMGAALLSYLVLSAIAKPVVVTAVQPNQIGQVMTQSVFRAMAMVGQFVVPVLCLAAAAVSAARRRHRAGLVASVARSRAPDALEGVGWREFELLVGEVFRLQGYEVSEVGGGGADGGVDLVLRKHREKFLVQCKQWKAFKVGVQVVREFYGVMAANGAAGGFVVTSGSFTEEAVAFASGRNVTLVDGPKLFGLIQEAKLARQGEEKTEILVKHRPTTPFASGSVEPAIVCPNCSKPMVRRVAKKGANAGNAFWGCSGYPSCRATRLIGP
jgi:restriction system protein